MSLYPHVNGFLKVPQSYQENTLLQCDCMLTTYICHSPISKSGHSLRDGKLELRHMDFGHTSTHIAHGMYSQAKEARGQGNNHQRKENGIRGSKIMKPRN